MAYFFLLLNDKTCSTCNVVVVYHDFLEILWAFSIDISLDWHSWYMQSLAHNHCQYYLPDCGIHALSIALGNYIRKSPRYASFPLLLWFSQWIQSIACLLAIQTLPRARANSGSADNGHFMGCFTWYQAHGTLWSQALSLTLASLTFDIKLYN